MFVSLLELPDHIIDEVIDLLHVDALPLSQTNSYFNFKVNRRIYSKIVVTDNKRRKTGSTDNTLGFRDTRWQDQGYTTIELDRVKSLAVNLNGRTIPFIKHLVLMSQADTSSIEENPFQTLYEKINACDQGYGKLQVDNLDVNNLRAYQSITQINKTASPKTVTFENDDTEQDSRYAGAVMRPPTSLVNWTLFDLDELKELPRNELITEINVNTEAVNPSGLPSATQMPFLPDLVPNLSTLYLNLPAATLSFLSQTTPRRLLKLEKLSVTNLHSLRNFGFKSINTKLTYRTLSKFIDLNALKELELKINCDFHQRCEDNCISEFFNDWEALVSQSNSMSECDYGLAPTNLTKLVLVNFKSNTSEANINQFADLVNNKLPLQIFGNLEELFIQVDDFTNIQPPHRMPETPANNTFDFGKILRQITTCTPNLRKLTLPDFYNTWFINIRWSSDFNKNFFDRMVNSCGCTHCAEGRYMFQKYAEYDSAHGYNHKFTKISDCLQGFDGNSFVDTSLSVNFKFLNCLVNSLKEKYSILYTNLFTINSVLKQDELSQALMTTNPNFVKMATTLLHSSLLEMLKEFPLPTSIKEFDLGGITYFNSQGRPFQSVASSY